MDTTNIPNQKLTFNNRIIHKINKPIMIVEDTEFNIDLLTQLLEEKYQLLVARDGAESLLVTEKNKPDLILMDISLPVMDGYEAARQIHLRLAYARMLYHIE